VPPGCPARFFSFHHIIRSYSKRASGTLV